MHAVEEYNVTSFNSFRDIEIQERLLEADEAIIANELLNRQVLANRWQKTGCQSSNSEGIASNTSDGSRNKNSHASVQKYKDTIRTIPFCGWYVDHNIIYRRAENNGSNKSKVAAVPTSKEVSLNRDSKSKTFSSQDFVFQHYLDVNSYIQQYRREHTCMDSATWCQATSDVSNLRKPHSSYQHSPLTVFSQTNIFQQDATLVPKQLDSLSGPNCNKQYQPQSRLQQAPTIQLMSKQDQQRHKIHAKLKNGKKAFPPPISTHEASKGMGTPDSAHSSSHSDGASSAKELIVIPAVTDAPFRRAVAAMMKVHTLNIDSLPLTHSKFTKPGSMLDPSTGSDLLGHRIGFDTWYQTKMLDATTFRLGSGNQKQRSWGTEIASCPDVHLEPSAVVNMRELSTMPAQLFITGLCKEQLQTWGPDFSEAAQALQSLPMKKSRSDVSKNSIEMIALLNSVQQASDEKNLSVSKQIPKQNFPDKDSCLLSVTGKHCNKSRTFVTDHLATARIVDEKLMLSHKMRIRHLIEQAKLKRKFDQILNKPKVPSKAFLQIKSIQITDPFAKIVPPNIEDANSNNRWIDGQNVVGDLHSRLVDHTNNSSIHATQNKMFVDCIDTLVKDKI